MRQERVKQTLQKSLKQAKVNYSQGWNFGNIYYVQYTIKQLCIKDVKMFSLIWGSKYISFKFGANLSNVGW